MNQRECAGDNYLQTSVNQQQNSRARWQETLNHSSSLLDLRRAVKDNGEASPCISGCRSICWKVCIYVMNALSTYTPLFTWYGYLLFEKMFLLGQETDAGIWKHSLLESRSTYSSLREHFLKYVNHPEYLTAASSDPLADDPDVSGIQFQAQSCS